ncbi:M3 family oligoendopeptidase [Thalassobacillus pellis]|uniref:M3 family oligoendopeptidase n=1 Tax=Thalassobacillus pellis TaxID=748008 RepID=UPI001961C633|nr:M3 family oligoendopeptidase [Thalassobacillus pellis]MBM7553725.1 pepF/M3 family oligoendopeptidase [Thalassobacillus pellis]
MLHTYNPKWDLTSIFEGGSESEELADYVDRAEVKLKELNAKIDAFHPPERETDSAGLEEVLYAIQQVAKMSREFGAYVSCLTAQDVNDKKAGEWLARRSRLGAAYGNAWTKLDEKLALIPASVWSGLLEKPTLSRFAFVLNEHRRRANDKLPLTQEELINDLSVDGYHAWGHMYNNIVGKMKIEFAGEELSVGQAHNKTSSPDRNVRKEVSNKLKKAWEEQSDLFSETLNHLGGFRLQTYAHRGWGSILKEPLDINRMSENTLDTMWKTITKYKNIYKSYLERKAEMLGLEQLDMYDINAPIGETEQTMTYEAGARFITEQFREFSPKMAEFAEMAFEKRWIEAEDRPGKRPGGFCTSFPDSRQTRIFMTYSGTASNVATLAHELGHAYHQHVMNDMPVLNQGYAMNVAETASTFAEMIVADAAVKNAASEEEKLILLEDKIQRSVAFFMNIHARFLFEKRFYEERRNGVVPAHRLNQLMLEAQQEAYSESLNEYDPYFWASKLHFHITGVPFYNFPYTFGYLFSLGIYKKAVEEGPGFEAKYIALLQDTGRMCVEDLARKHLGVELEEPEFWEDAMEMCSADVKDFLELTKVRSN